MSICSASAQNFSVEGVAGMNVSNLGGVGAKIGFHAGARFELAIPAITEGIYTNAGLLFSLKGYALDWGVVRSKSNAYYIDIPIHMGYKYSHLRRGWSIFRSWIIWKNKYKLRLQR